MPTTMNLVFSTHRRGQVIFTTDTIDRVSNDPLEIHAYTNTHEIFIRSKAHARRVALDKGYVLKESGDAWESLPEEH